MKQADWLRTHPITLVPMAIVVGAITGLGAVAFRYLITAFTRMFTGYADYSALGRVASTHWPALGFWFLLVTPVVAGAVYGPIVHHFAPEARGHGVPEVMYAVAHRGGRIAPQVTVVKALASALCIGGGGSVGREGPIVQIGSAAGSALAQLLRLNTDRVRLLVACGAAGGISATFNTPLAGAFFAIELILRTVAAEAFGAVVLSSVTAAVVGRALLGDHPFLALPAFAVRNPIEYLLYAILGVAAGVVGVAFSKVLYLVEDLCDWLWRGPEWARPACGGIVLGALLIALPQMYGVGYPVLESAISGHYLLGMLVLLMVGKMVATSLTIGIGGSGGVFAPTLVHRRHGRHRIRHGRASVVAGTHRISGGLRSDRDGRRARRRDQSTDHRGGHSFRADRRVLHHSAVDGGGGDGRRYRTAAVENHYLHREAVAARSRPRPFGAAPLHRRGDRRARTATIASGHRPSHGRNDSRFIVGADDSVRGQDWALRRLSLQAGPCRGPP